MFSARVLVVGSANQVGALTVTQLGAKPSLPTLEEVQAFRQTLDAAEMHQ